MSDDDGQCVTHGCDFTATGWSVWTVAGVLEGGRFCEDCLQILERCSEVHRDRETERRP